MEESFLEQAVEWLLTNGLVIVLVMASTSVVRRFVFRLITRVVRKSIQPDNFSSPESEKKREDTLISILQATAKVIIWVVSGIIIISLLGVNIAPLIAGVSVVGVAVGFGAQSLVKDVVAGTFIIMENQYRVGDVVELRNVSGTVVEITMRQTVLRDIDGNLHHIPNGLIEVATNMTMEFANVHLMVGVSYDSDIKKVEKLINQVGNEMADDKNWKDKIIETPQFVRVDNFGPSEVVIKILGKVKPGQQWAVAGEFRQRMKTTFDKEGVEIPFPQRVVHQAKN